LGGVTVFEIGLDNNKRRVLRRLLQRVVGLSNNVLERIHPHFVEAQHPHVLHSGVYMHHVILQAPQVKLRPTLQMPRALRPRLSCSQPRESTGCVQHLRPGLVHHVHHRLARLRRGHGVVRERKVVRALLQELAHLLLLSLRTSAAARQPANALSA
jgi:hypothetical protein